jgi:GAF domain-containing protein
MSSPSLTPGDTEYPGLKDTLTAVCEAAVKLVGVEHSGLVLFFRDKEQGEEYGEVVTEYPVLEHSVVGQRFRIKDIELEQQLVHSRQPMVVTDVAAESSLGGVQRVLLEMGVKSLVAVPIVVDDEVKGSFSFDALNQTRDFNEADVAKCESLAKFASLVVKNSYLIKNLEALRQAMLAISSEPERVSLLQKITEEAAHLVGADGGGIDELDHRKQELTIVAKFNMPDHIVGKTMKVGEGLAGTIIKDNWDHFTVEDYQNWDNKAPYFRDEPSLQSLVGVPLSWNDKTKPTGVLWLNDKRPRVFSTDDIELLKRLAEPASIALEHSSLREREKSETKRLRELARATNEIFVDLGTSSRQERLDRIAKKAHEIIDAELCGIFLVQKPGWLTLEAGHGYAEGKFEKGKQLEIRPGPGTGLTGYIASSKEIFNKCGDELKEHEARAQPIDPFYRDYSPSGQCFSLLGLPLTADNGELKGLITINNKNDRDGKPNQWTCFSKDDVAIAEIFAQAALVAIETADLQDRYKTLWETSSLLTLTKVPEDGLAALAKMVLRQINKSFCRILFYHEADQSIQVIAAEKADGPKGDFQWEQRLGEKTGVADWRGLAESLKSGDFVVQRRGQSQDYDANLDHLSDLIKLRDKQDGSLPIHSLLRGPLKVKDQIIGLLIIGELDPNAGFSEFEVDLAQWIAAHASQLIERLQSNKKLLVDLFETERKISTSPDASLALKWVAETIYEVGHAYARRVTVVDVNVRSGNQVRVVAAYPENQLDYIRSIVGDPFDLANGFPADHRLGLVGTVLTTGKPLNESDVHSNPAYIPIHEDTLSQLVVPIKDGEDVIGALSVESEEASAFDDQDQMLVEGVAVLAASALSREKHSREYKKVRTVALAGAAARLWRHGLKQRATFILGKIDAALEKPGAVDLKEVLLGVRKDAKHIQDFRFIPLSSEEGVADEVLNDLLWSYLRAFREHTELGGLQFGMHLKIDATKGYKVRDNLRWFQKALSIFLDNATEAIKKSPVKFINIETDLLEGSRCQIRVRNSGPKIPLEIWDKMAQEQIVRDDQNSDKGGGLLLADLILAVYGGKIEKLNNEEDDIVLALTLPVLP